LRIVVRLRELPTGPIQTLGSQVAFAPAELHLPDDPALTQLGQFQLAV
jgi:hypothetical protein